MNLPETITKYFSRPKRAEAIAFIRGASLVLNILKESADKLSIGVKPEDDLQRAVLQLHIDVLMKLHEEGKELSAQAAKILYPEFDPLTEPTKHPKMGY